MSAGSAPARAEQPLQHLRDAETGKARIRLVDVRSTRYAIARRYMIRVRRDDFEDPQELAKFAVTANLSVEDFRRQFEYLIEDEPPPLDIRANVDVMAE